MLNLFTQPARDRIAWRPALARPHLPLTPRFALWPLVEAT